MRAFVYERYGPPEVLELREVPAPVPKDDEILIRIRATTVSSGDWRMRSMNVPRGFRFLARLALGFTRPRQPILGTELSGEVEAIGRAVRRFKPGDEVFAFPGARGGAHAEYRCMRAEGLVAPKPSRLTHDEAAALSFGGTTAIDFFRRARLQRGERVLVNGASGAVGVAAVQLARHMGAEVTGVCSTANTDLVKSLGAHRVIDYTKDDFTRSGERWDVIMDTAGTAPFARSRTSLSDRGRLLIVLGGVSALFQGMMRPRTIIAGNVAPRPEDLLLLADLAGKGEYKAVIDRRYPFEQMIEAHRYVDAGHKKGSVVVTLGP